MDNDNPLFRLDDNLTSNVQKHAAAMAWIAQWYATPDAQPPGYWNEFEELLNANRLTFGDADMCDEPAGKYALVSQRLMDFEGSKMTETCSGDVGTVSPITPSKKGHTSMRQETPWQSLVERYTMDLEDEAHFLTWLRSKDIHEEEARYRLTAAELDAAYDTYDRLTAPAGLLTAAHLALLYQMADEADQAWHKAFLPTDAQGLHTQLTRAMERIAGQLKDMLATLSGENPWENATCTHCRWPQKKGSRTGD